MHSLPLKHRNTPVRVQSELVFAIFDRSHRLAEHSQRQIYLSGTCAWLSCLGMVQSRDSRGGVCGQILGTEAEDH